MVYFLSIVVCCFGFVLLADGLSDSSADSPCSDWKPFKNEKCIKLVDRVALQTKEDGEIICRAFAEELHTQETPKLVTIKTEEEQKFLQKLLFEDLGHLDNVWLGLEFGKDDLFHWNDGTDLLFTNWVEESMAESERHCVQMESGEGAYERGKWVRVNCKKRNAIVCERPQPWSHAALQNIVLSLRLEVAKNKEEVEQKLKTATKEAEQKLNDAKKEAEQKLKDAKKETEQKLKDAKKEAEQKINESNQKINEANQITNAAIQKINAVSQEIESLKKTSGLIPVGFIYVQLPGQDPPATLWPQTSWQNLGLDYAGLFFRVEGGNAAPFGELQTDNTRRLAQVAYEKRLAHDWISAPEIPADGSWSAVMFDGSFYGPDHFGLKFRSSPGEIRPQK